MERKLGFMNLDQLKQLKPGDIIDTETIHHQRKYKVLKIEPPKSVNDTYHVTIKHLADYDNEPMELEQTWFVGVNGTGNPTRQIMVLKNDN